jgi:hypothetical protein
MAIGQDLLDVPFADLVHQLALGIADAQHELDKSSIETLDFLSTHTASVITEITDVITSAPGSATVPGTGQAVDYTGAQVASTVKSANMTLLQAGITPTFYQFTEASIEVKLSISVQESSQSSGESRPARALQILASPVNYRTQNTYSYTAQGSSVFRAVMRPVPAPSRLTPRTITVDATVSPPRVTSVG